MCFVGFNLSAQNVQRATLGSSGDSNRIHNVEESYYISYSVGQSSVIGTTINDQYAIRQGFQQPPILVEISENANNNLEAIVFPNPVDSYITIRFNQQVTNTIHSVLYDVSGKRILDKSQRPTSSFNMDLSFLASGAYLLNITSGNKKFQARLIKK